MLGQTSGPRPVGVKIPEHQNTDRTDRPDFSVISMVPLELFAAQYVENGRVKMGLFCHSGGTFYMVPDGEPWLQKFRTLRKEMVVNVQHIYESLKGKTPEDIPLHDTVDVVAGSVAQEAPKTNVDV